MAWKAEREEEEKYFANIQEQPEDLIHTLRIGYNSRKDLVFLFDTPTHSYSLIAVLQDGTNLGWKECQCLSDCMRIASRGTRMDPASFTKLSTTMQGKYGRVEGPLNVDERNTMVIFPPRGNVQGSKPHMIDSTSLQFDSDLDLQFESKSNKGIVYYVVLEMTLPQNKFSKMDCSAFLDILQLLEPGDVRDPNEFLSFGYEMKKKYNFVKPIVSDNRMCYRLSILTSKVDNSGSTDTIFQNVIEDKYKAEERTGEDDVEAFLPCPYPGITYSSAFPESGQAQVYKGSKGETSVAVKVFPEGEEQMSEFKTELKNLLKMSHHKNVVTVIDFFEQPQPALVTHFIDGMTLMDYLEKKGKLSIEDGKKICLGIAEGLAHLHKHGIVHRDLKSPNILCRDDGTPVIIDLGLSSNLKRRNTLATHAATFHQIATRATQGQVSGKTETVKGTYLWMAPEMMEEQMWSDRTDVYSFGIIMWEVFSSKKPYLSSDGDFPTTPALILNVVRGRRPDMKEVDHIDRELQDLMQICWHSDPLERPSMKRVLDLLKNNDPRLIFKSVDVNGDGLLSFAEFVAFLERYEPGKVPRGDMDPLFTAIDTDNSGEISLDEFESFWSDVERHGLKNLLEKLQSKRNIPGNTSISWKNKHGNSLNLVNDITVISAGSKNVG